MRGPPARSAVGLAKYIRCRLLCTGRQSPHGEFRWRKPMQTWRDRGLVRRIRMHGRTHAASCPGMADPPGHHLPSQAGMPSAHRRAPLSRATWTRGSRCGTGSTIRSYVRWSHRMLSLLPGERSCRRKAMHGSRGRTMERWLPAGVAARERPTVERPGELPLRGRPTRRAQGPSRTKAC